MTMRISETFFCIFLKLTSLTTAIGQSHDRERDEEESRYFATALATSSPATTTTSSPTTLAEDKQ